MFVSTLKHGTVKHLPAPDVAGVQPYAVVLDARVGDPHIGQRTLPACAQAFEYDPAVPFEVDEGHHLDSCVLG
jgi:hypothetical protein